MAPLASAPVAPSESHAHLCQASWKGMPTAFIPRGLVEREVGFPVAPTRRHGLEARHACNTLPSCNRGRRNKGDELSSPSSPGAVI